MGSKPQNEMPTFIEGAIKISNAADLKKNIKEAKQSLICICFFNESEPCRKIASRLRDLTDQFKEVVFLLGLDDECAEVMQAFSLTMLPTFILIQNMIILEIFVGCSYYRTLRRIELRLLDGEREGKRYKELLRVSKIANDNVYVLKSTQHDTKGRASAKATNILGLSYATSGPIWKDRTKMFVEACEKARKSEDFISYFYDPHELSEPDFEAHATSQRYQRIMDDTPEEMKTRRISFGQHFELRHSKRKKGKHSTKKAGSYADPSSASQPLLQESSRPLPSLDDLSPPQTADVDMEMYSDLKDTIIAEEIQDFQKEVADNDKCTVVPELLVHEDRNYTKQEVIELINKCMKVCWVDRHNKELDVKAPIPPTMNFAENLDEILSSSAEGSKESLKDEDNISNE